MVRFVRSVTRLKELRGPRDPTEGCHEGSVSDVDYAWDPLTGGHNDERPRCSEPETTGLLASVRLAMRRYRDQKIRYRLEDEGLPISCEADI